jgi:putative transposase
MARLLHPLFFVLAYATDKQLAKYLEYLKVENRILRSKLPKRITITPSERAKLVKHGKPLGKAIKDLITIVTPRTFARWVGGDGMAKQKPAKLGRPRKPEEIRALIIRMAQDTGWGYRRIFGELRKLRIKVSRSTVHRILRENGFDPGPKRGEGTWNEFIKRHIKTLWACDFFTKKVWTVRGLVEYYILFFIHIETRQVHIVGMTPNPDGIWMAQQARNLSMFFAEQGMHFPTHIILDRDTKFTKVFKSILEYDGIEFREIPPLSPNLNPFAERWVQSVKRECLDHFIVFGEGHLQHLLREYVSYFHQFRPHQGIGNVLLSQRDQSEVPIEATISIDEMVCHELLGGLLKHYERKAA